MRNRLVLAVSLVALCGLSACDWMKAGDAPGRKSEAQLAAERRERIRKACASEATYARLKDYVFDEAARIRNGDPRNLDPVAAGSVVRMEEPLVKSRDEELNVTVCTGRFTLELPPGAENAFDGLRRVTAEVEYSAQAAADGSGLVYRMDGAEPIIYRLATFGFNDAQPAAPTRTASAEPPPARSASPPPSPAPAPAQRPAPSPVPAPERAERVAAAPAPRAEPAPRAAARPSYNCRFARTVSEKRVCSSPDLAARDRGMSAAYYRAIAGAAPEAKGRIRASRDAFLARRERCGGSEACIARAYDMRVAEIRRMAGE